MTDEPQNSLQRLDPDRAARRPTPDNPPRQPQPDDSFASPRPETDDSFASPRSEPDAQFSPPIVVETRRYRWMIGVFGLAVVLIVSIYQFATNGTGTAGVPAGHRLRFFAAPLADTNLNGSPNLNPPCTLARHDPRALNICLIAASRPLVLSFFVTGSSQCVKQVDVLQQLSTRFPPTSVEFAAVAIGASHAATAKLVRTHHWTIPVAYDSDGAVGALYGVVVCPMTELAYRGGIVKDRLIGRWQSGAALAPQVAALVRGSPPALVRGSPPAQ